MKTLLTIIIILGLLILLLKWGTNQIIGYRVNSKRKKLIKGGYEIHPNAMREEEKQELRNIGVSTKFNLKTK